MRTAHDLFACLCWESYLLILRAYFWHRIQESLLVILGGPYGMSEIGHGLATCKANALPAGLSLWLHGATYSYFGIQVSNERGPLSLRRISGVPEGREGKLVTAESLN